MTERKRSFIRGFAAGVGVHVLLALALAFLLSKTTAAIANARGIANPLAIGPFEPMSSGWLATQLGRIVIGIAAGAAAAHWERPSVWFAPLALAVVLSSLAAFSVPSIPLPVAIPWVLLDVPAVLAGAFLYSRRVRNAA